LDFLQSRHLDLIFWVSITVETARFEQHDPSFGPEDTASVHHQQAVPVASADLSYQNERDEDS
jgi:hypothetical protein